MKITIDAPISGGKSLVAELINRKLKLDAAIFTKAQWRLVINKEAYLSNHHVIIMRNHTGCKSTSFGELFPKAKVASTKEQEANETSPF